MPPAYKTREDALAGLNSSFNPTTDAQRQAIAEAVANIPKAVTPESMNTTPTITPTNPTPTTVPDVNSLQSQIDTVNKQYETPLPNQGEIDPLRKSIMELTGTASQETAERAQLEADPALQAKRQQVLDLTNQANALIAESKAIPIRLQQEAVGKGMTAGGLAPIQTAQLRNNAIQALSVSSLLSASQGNLSLALDQVDRTIKAKFDPIKAELEAKRANLEMLMNDPAITREEKRRADIATITLNYQEKQQQKAEANMKSVQDLAVKLAGFGNVPNNILKSIQGAKTFDEALALATPYMQDPAVAEAIKGAKLDNILKQSQINKAQEELRLLQKYDGLTPTEYAKKLADEKKAIDTAKTEEEKYRLQSESLGGHVTLMDSILNNPAIDSVVGPTALNRANTLGQLGMKATPFTLPSLVSGISDTVTGASDRLVGQTEQFISGEFLKNLIEVKKQGATFGALTKPEQDALTASATYIGQRRIYDTEDGNYKDGAKVIGYDMSEEDFKREIGTIKASAQTAYERALGKTFNADEQAILDQAFQTASSTVTDFNPESYFR